MTENTESAWEPTGSRFRDSLGYTRDPAIQRYLPFFAAFAPLREAVLQADPLPFQLTVGDLSPCVLYLRLRSAMVRKHLPLIAFTGLVLGPPVTGIVADRLGGPGWAVGILTFLGACLLIVAWCTVKAFRHHLRQRVELIRSLENLRGVAADGPPPLAGPASAVILLIVAVPFLFLATLMAGSDDSGEVMAAAIPLAISLCAQLAAGWRLRDWHLRRAAWREALAHGEVKGRWRAVR